MFAIEDEETLYQNLKHLSIKLYYALYYALYFDVNTGFNFSGWLGANSAKKINDKQFRKRDWQHFGFCEILRRDLTTCSLPRGWCLSAALWGTNYGPPDTPTT